MCYGIQFTTPGAGGSAVPLIKEAIVNGERFWTHAFEYTCAINLIDVVLQLGRIKVIH
ncbi:hypothetical protein IE4872_PD01697 (plasmid) [Rhizobium gallicum]|uniref:Uncharacterized protein n=1 Tax=Rhizobium gallicum TaxID=56730 RepID=A0A1L5NWG7_9HYPH|nr:hypothetical protein IE4872_PD01697 [Rhizobium gallicum]